MLAGTTARGGASSSEQAAWTVALAHYEGLIFMTAQRLVHSGVENELEDIMQLLRIKAWKGLMAFNPAKARGMTQDRYIFMVLRDQAKDIAKRKRRGELLIEDIAPNAQLDSSPRDSFDMRYLGESHEQVYGAVEAAPPLIPNTLSGTERAVLALLYRDFSHKEIALRLDISRPEVATAVRALKSKLQDWAPADVISPPAVIAV